MQTFKKMQLFSRKKARKSVIFCLKVLQIQKKAVPLHRNQETKSYISKTIQSYIIAFRSLIYLHVSVIGK